MRWLLMIHSKRWTPSDTVIDSIPAEPWLYGFYEKSVTQRFSPTICRFIHQWKILGIDSGGNLLVRGFSAQRALTKLKKKVFSCYEKGTLGGRKFTANRKIFYGTRKMDYNAEKMIGSTVRMV
jgi:hypothetical protein